MQELPEHVGRMSISMSGCGSHDTGVEAHKDADEIGLQHVCERSQMCIFRGRSVVRGCTLSFRRGARH